MMGIKNKDGFTVIELIILLLIIGIISIVVINDFVPSLSATRLEAGRWKLKSDIIYAQSLAAAQQISHGVIFDTALNRYSVYRQNITNIVNEPSTKQPFTVSFASDPDFKGVSITGTNFGDRLEFDSYGTPSDGSANLSSNATVTLGSGPYSGVVTIIKNTGKAD